MECGRSCIACDRHDESAVSQDRPQRRERLKDCIRVPGSFVYGDKVGRVLVRTGDLVGVANRGESFACLERACKPPHESVVLRGQHEVRDVGAVAVPRGRVRPSRAYRRSVVESW